MKGSEYNMNSNLSKYDISLGNHMVTALTQESVNNTMKEYLYYQSVQHDTYMLCTIDDAGKSIYFSVSRNTDMSMLPDCFPAELRRKELYSELEGLELFSIPSDKDKQTSEQKQSLEKAYCEYYVESAFQFITGLPSIFSPADIKDFVPVELLASTAPSGCGALYTQCFSEIVVIEFKEKRSSVVVNIQKQSESEKPWMIAYTVLFNFKSQEFGKLPETVRQAILEHFGSISAKDIPNLFEISQLMLDFTTLSRTSVPDIIGVDKETKLNIIAAFEEYIHENLEEALVSGYAILPSNRNTYEYIFKPVKYSFSVTENKTKNAVCKTLNYIMSTTDAEIVPQKYDWDWVNPNNPDTKSGAMVICRDIFFDRFNLEFKKVMLSGLRKHFIARMEGNHGGLWDLKYCYSMESDYTPDEGSFSFSENENVYKYTDYSYKSVSDFISVYVPPFFAATAQLEFDYSFKCTVKWGEITEAGVVYPAIVYFVEITLYTDIAYDSGHSTGNVYHHTIECGVGIKIDEYGKVSLIKQIKDTDHNDKIDISGWSTFASFGAMQELVDGITGRVESWMEDVVEGFKNSFANGFLGYANWVMLGNKTFTFSKEEFSDYGDFCVNVKYVNPAEDYIREQIKKHYGK